MASLDDFFAKRDKKKGKSKKFTTTDEIAKQLEEGGKKTDKPEPKPKKDRPKGNAEDGSNIDAAGSEAGDEWKDYKEESEKDYTGLKIQKLNINDMEDEPDGGDGEGVEGETPVSRNVWKVAAAAEEPQPQASDAAEAAEPEPAVRDRALERGAELKTEPEETATASGSPDLVEGEPAVPNVKKAYVPPNRRKEMSAASNPAPVRVSAPRGRPRVAPDINSEEFFPSLSTQPAKSS